MMKRALKMWSGFALLIAILCMASMTALAQGGGSGGGGGNETATTAPPLIFDFSPAISGSTPSWSGDSTITNSIPGYYSFAVLSLNIKAKSLNLPNNTVLQVTAYTSNKLTGQSLPPISVSGMTVLSKSVSLKSKTTIVNFTFDSITRQLDKVTIATGDGTIIATCHP